jgi:vacuolar-type H+-ATPase subunit C/Vma6
VTVWVDVVARARGLSDRLLKPAALAELAHAADLRHLAVALAERRGRPAPESAPSAAEIEDAERRYFGAQIRLLARWAGARAGLLAPLYEEEDFRSIRALLRGAVARTPADDRLSGLIPTPALPLRSLALLANCATPSAMAALLVTWGNPHGPLLLAEASRQQPDLFAMEHALVKGWAARGRRAASRGGRALRIFVARQVDLANCWSVLLVAEHGYGGPTEALFIDGGDIVTRDAFRLAAGASGRARTAVVLDGLVRRTPLSAAIGHDAGVEERVRRALVREQRAIARQDPLGPALIIEYWLRLRGEAAALRRVIWGLVAGAPASARSFEPVEP